MKTLTPMQELPDFPLSFKRIGSVIETVGTPDFVSRLTLLLNDVVPLNVVHIERSKLDKKMPTGFRCEWIGSSGVGMDSKKISEVMALYYERFYKIDPLFADIRGKIGTILVVRDIGAIPPGEFRQRLFDEASISQECVLARGTRYVQHSIAVERTLNTPPFSLGEMNRFRKISEFLFPLLELHAATSAAKRVAHPTSYLHPLAQFEERLAAENVQLSRREYEICAHLICGMTMPEAATALEVRLSTAQSYVKRAFVKINVRTKRELCSWGLGSRHLPVP